MNNSPDKPLSEFTDLSQNLPPERPTSVTVFGILNLILGGLGLCRNTMTGAELISPSSEMFRTSPTLAMMDESAIFCFFIIISVSLSFVAAVVLMISGIGLLKLRPYGRQLAIVFGIYSVAMKIIGLLVNVFVLFPRLKAQSGEPLAGFTVEDANRTMVTVTLANSIGLIYAGLLLYFMCRPYVAEAFKFEFTNNS